MIETTTVLNSLRIETHLFFFVLALPLENQALLFLSTDLTQNSSKPMQHDEMYKSCLWEAVPPVRTDPIEQEHTHVETTSAKLCCYMNKNNPAPCCPSYWCQYVSGVDNGGHKIDCADKRWENNEEMNGWLADYITDWMNEWTIKLAKKWRNNQN